MMLSVPNQFHGWTHQRHGPSHSHSVGWVAVQLNGDHVPLLWLASTQGLDGLVGGAPEKSSKPEPSSVPSSHVHAPEVKCRPIHTKPLDDVSRPSAQVSS